MKSRNGFSFPINPSQTKNFLKFADANGLFKNNCGNRETIAVKYYQLSDIEMVVLQASGYTSIKDLLPTSSPTSILSPTASRMDSWREIPIRDPLLKHAAWAYLQPTGAVSDSDDRNLLEKLKEKCCGVFACFGDVLLVIRRACFSKSVGGESTEEDGGEEGRVD